MAINQTVTKGKQKNKEGGSHIKLGAFTSQAALFLNRTARLSCC